MQMPGDFVAHWRLLPYLRVNFLELHHLGDVRRAGKFHATATATLKSSNRVCDCYFSVLDHSLNLQSNPAVIVRHRIVKPRLDDELAAIDDFPYRRPSAWRDANAMIANLIHPLVYAPEPTCRKMRSMICVSLISDTGRISCWNWDVMDVIGTQQRINFPDLLDQLAPRTRRNAPRLERAMLDDFNRRACERTTPLQRCCRRPFSLMETSRSIKKIASDDLAKTQCLAG